MVRLVGVLQAPRPSRLPVVRPAADGVQEPDGRRRNSMVQQVLQSRLLGDSVVAGMFLVLVGIGFPLAMRFGV
jgi:hypothetical protein